MDIEEVLASEQADLEDLETLQGAIVDLAQLRIVNRMFARKTARVIALTLLHQYRDTQKEETNGNGTNGGS